MTFIIYSDLRRGDTSMTIQRKRKEKNPFFIQSCHDKSVPLQSLVKKMRKTSFMMLKNILTSIWICYVLREDICMMHRLQYLIYDVFWYHRLPNVDLKQDNCCNCSCHLNYDFLPYERHLSNYLKIMTTYWYLRALMGPDQRLCRVVIYNALRRQYEMTWTFDHQVGTVGSSRESVLTT